MIRTRHRPRRGKAILALLAATAALAGAQALSPAPAAAMIYDDIGKYECERLFGEWTWDGTCVLNFGGGGSGGSTAGNGRDAAGGKPAKSEEYRLAELVGLLAQMEENELLLRDSAAWLTGKGEGVAPRQACRRIRKNIQYFQYLSEDDNPHVSRGYRRFRDYVGSEALRLLEGQEDEWVRRDCDHVLSYRGW